jgi:gp16 family phage-associated protein
MDSEQRNVIIKEKLEGLGITINEWAKSNELDHRIVEDLINGNLRGTHGVALNARKKMEDFFGPIFTEH